MTISSEDQKVDKKKFDVNFDKIFGNKCVKRGAYIQDPVTHKLVPRETFGSNTRPDAPMINKPFEGFISPVDQKPIESRRQLAEHNKRHGVTDSRDYSANYLERATQQRETSSKRELKQSRISDIKRSIDLYSQ
jgi:hypothetical protein|tara:strand:+ start:4734 stop:5135 length:402 start_codon:yes stop_codon:yes gene_type:complete